MDLATMAKKVQAGEYKGVEQLQTDFKLMISNCKKYNSQKSRDEDAADEAERYRDYAVQMEQFGNDLIEAVLGDANSDTPAAKKTRRCVTDHDSSSLHLLISVLVWSAAPRGARRAAARPASRVRAWPARESGTA